MQQNATDDSVYYIVDWNIKRYKYSIADNTKI